MHFLLDVEANTEGTLHGRLTRAGADVAMQFWGIADLVGLLQNQLCLGYRRSPHADFDLFEPQLSSERRNETRE